MEEGGRVRWRRNEVERKEDQEVEETRIGGGGEGGGSKETEETKRKGRGEKKKTKEVGESVFHPLTCSF